MYVKELSEHMKFISPRKEMRQRKNGVVDLKGLQTHDLWIAAITL